MYQIKNFCDLIAWQKAHEIVITIYKITEGFPRCEKYSMVNQLRRSAASITANIAEGFDRFHFNEKIQFYYIARGSAGEVMNFIILARDLNFISSLECENQCNKLTEIKKLINGLIKSTVNR